jgi:hypothetical protein
MSKGKGKRFQGEGSEGNPHHQILRLRQSIKYAKTFFAVEMYLFSHPKAAGGDVFLLHS